jgi:hypothetical protein
MGKPYHFLFVDDEILYFYTFVLFKCLEVTISGYMSVVRIIKM